MSDLYKNPEDEAQSREMVKRQSDHGDWGGTRMNGVGPAGTNTHINQNEKGILEDGLFEAMSFHQEAALGSNHDSFSQGIYADSGEKYGD